MQALKKDIGQPWKLIEIQNDVLAFKKYVGGNINITQFSKAAVISDRDAKKKKKPFNVSVYEEEIRGNVLLVGTDGENFFDLPYANTLALLLNGARKEI